MQQNKQLFRGHSICYAHPDGFVEADSKLFYPDNFEDQIPAVEMLVLESVVVVNGFLIKGNTFLYDFSHHANSIGGSKWKSLLRLKVFHKQHLELAIWGVYDWADNYFHWVTELMPRILAMHKTNKEVPVLLSEKVSGLSFVKQVMELFRIPYKVLPVGRGVKIDRLLACKVPHVGQCNQYLFSAFREDVFALNPSDQLISPDRKLYISRSDARRRKILNEDSLWQSLQHQGFERVGLEGMNWYNQLKLFKEAALVVSNHGAGLTNIAFMAQGGRVIELKSKNNDYWCYFSLSRVIGLKYAYILCDGNNIDHRSADIVVDVDAVLHVIKQDLIN